MGEIRDLIREVWDIIRRVENPNPFVNLQQERDNIKPLLIDLWDKDPHNAMEALEGAAEAFPLNLVQGLVKEVVQSWKTRNNYSWKAGGGADHCFLWALLITGNYEFIEEDFFNKCLSSIEYKLKNPRDRISDKLAKHSLAKSYISGRT